MMRFQRVSPDCVPLSNRKKPNHENGRSTSNGFNTASITFENKGFRFRSPSRDHHHQSSIASSPQHSDSNHNQTRRQDTSSSPSPSRGGSGDILLQWGQKKRTRASRSEIRPLFDESSSSGNTRQPFNKARRVDGSKLSAPSMPPPPPPPPPPQQSRGGNFKKESSTLLSHRNAEKQSVAGNGSPSRNSGCSSKVVSRSTIGKRYPPTPDNTERKIPSSRSTAKDEKPNESTAQADHMNRANSAPTHSEQEAGVSKNNIAPAIEKVNNVAVAEVIKWPRIYLALSRREKEDDFFAINGTKLPQRPKKRAKNIDKALKYCYPGMWLSDLTKSRYEVREKKCVKKQKRRGLKGLKSVESDSE